MTGQTTKPKKSVDDLVEGILENTPTIEEAEIVVNFPSKGQYYKKIDDSLPITIRPMNFSDEKLLASKNNNNPNEIINLIISKCLNNMNAGDLINMDKSYVLLKLREISYGKEFKFIIKCPGCKDEADLTINLSQFDVTYLPEKYPNPREILLPGAKKKATVIFPKSSDSQYQEDVETASNNLYRFIVDIDGHKDKTVINKVIQSPRFLLSDMHVLLNAINEPDYGVDTQFIYQCEVSSCKQKTLMGVPFDDNFFTMK